ncbi:MAG: DeoR/GlpR family DNA-binding transcription regulator [Opitutales bacterium]
MLAPERQQQILALLEEQGTVRTTDLAEEFQVTDETIRRDLQALAENHQVNRIHGGASSLNGKPKLVSFNERRYLHVEQKKAIARAALEWIEAEKTFIFDSSTTALELVAILPDLPFRVITNAHFAINQLINHEQVELLSTGGRYHAKTQTFNSSSTLQTLRRHNINRAFISCVGLDLKRGVSEGFEEQAAFKEALIQVAEQVILLVDSSKLNQCSEYFFAGLEQISLIITDAGADPDFLASLRQQGCEVRIAQQ